LVDTVTLANSSAMNWPSADLVVVEHTLMYTPSLCVEPGIV